MTDREKAVEAAAAALDPEAWAPGANVRHVLDWKGRKKRSLIRARRIITAIEALNWRHVPEGHVVVPEEPTRKMLEAAEGAYFSTYKGTITASPDSVYRAMIAASKEEKPE